jgi:hypothetical protein
MDVIAVYSETRMKPLNTLCGQNTKLPNVKVGDTYSLPPGFNGLI